MLAVEIEMSTIFFGQIYTFTYVDNCFELNWSRTINVAKQVELICYYFTTTPDSRAGGWAAVEIKNKTN